MRTKSSLGRAGWRSPAVSASITSLIVVIAAAAPGLVRTSAASVSQGSVSAASDAVTVPAAAYIPDAPTLPREGWTAASGQSLPVHPAAAALDANALTYWDGRIAPGAPAAITIDMRVRQVVSGLTYEPPQMPSPVDVIGQYKVSVSGDGVDFATVATGTWSNTAAVKKIGIASVDARFVRLTALTTASGSGSRVAAAELYLQGAADDAAAPPPAAKSAVGAALDTNPAAVGQ